MIEKIVGIVKDVVYIVATLFVTYKTIVEINILKHPSPKECFKNRKK